MEWKEIWAPSRLSREAERVRERGWERLRECGERGWERLRECGERGWERLRECGERGWEMVLTGIAKI